MKRRITERASELDKARKAGLEQEKLIQKKLAFISTVSHELRTPLMVIMEGIDLVLDKDLGDLNPKQRDLLETAKRNVQRLARLVNSILDFQKLESGMYKLNIRQNDINEVVREIHESMAPAARRKGLEFTLNLADGVPKIGFDRDRICEVVMNLVDNAVKFTKKGSVSITTSRVENIIRFSIQNTGPEIKKDDLSKIFDPFEQVMKKDKRAKGETGLGLAICKDIIEKHRGKIWAESGPGRGTAFHFVLPIVERRG